MMPATAITATRTKTAADEFPTSLELKLRGKTIEDVTGGNLGAEARMGIVYTEGVGKRGMSYYTADDLPTMYSLASTYATADRYFCSLLGPTFPNRLFLYAATREDMGVPLDEPGDVT